MEQYLIPPEYCQIIKAFAEADSLRGAALLLNMDPAALVRKVQKISQEYKLLEKQGSKWCITDTGRKVARWYDESVFTQKELLEQKPGLRLSSFPWLAEEVLIPNAEKLRKLSSNKNHWVFQTNALDFEQELIHGRCDFVIACHAPHDPVIAHKKIMPDPWLAIAPIAWKKEVEKLKTPQLIQYLKNAPFIRHTSLNPEHTVGFEVNAFNDIMVDSIISLRTAVTSELGWACVPKLSVLSTLSSNKIFVLNHEVKTSGELNLWWIRSRKDVASHVKPLTQWLQGLE